jgi:hypothetical protein
MSVEGQFSSIGFALTNRNLSLDPDGPVGVSASWELRAVPAGPG